MRERRSREKEGGRERREERKSRKRKMKLGNERGKAMMRKRRDWEKGGREN